MFELKPFSESKPMCATWLKPLGAPIMLLSIAPFFFLPDDAAGALALLDPAEEYLAACLCRSEIFLNSSAASDSDEKARPIMHS